MLPRWSRWKDRRLLRRVLGLGLLVLLLTSGPVHLWHHFTETEGDGSPGQAGHQCLPCSVFAHLLFLDAGGIPLTSAPVLVGAVLLPEPAAPASIPAPHRTARAPPSPLS